jgi:hypothetical protein
LGFSFKKCIFPGIKVRYQKEGTIQGVIAFSKDSYKKFHRLFEKIILKIHGKLEHKTDWTLDVNEHSSDYKARQASMIDSIMIKTKRNLSGYPLCPGLDK